MTILQQYKAILSQFQQYEPRPAQEAMVQRIDQAMTSGSSLLVEAGPGSGKSFGYLIPALLQRKRPIVISTGTIALQEQLLEKDIPFIAKAAGLDDLNVQLVKGRSNYLCIQKLLEAEREVGYAKSGHFLHFQQIKSALQDGWDGDYHRLDWAMPREMWDEVASTSDDCLGRKCQFFQENPYRMAREQLEHADIIVANHALYCQHLAAGQSLLPPHDIVVFDEAHSLHSYALNAFTSRIGKYATTRLLQKVKKRLTSVPEGYMRPIQEVEAMLLTRLFQLANDRPTFPLPGDDRVLELVHQQMVVLDEVRSWLAQMDVKQLVLEPLNQRGMDLEADKLGVKQGKLVQQLDDLILRWQMFSDLQPVSLANPRLNWVEVDPGRIYFELRSTPLNLADTFRTLLWKDKTAILASATLSTNQSMTFVREQLGLDSDMADELILPSPFDFKNQCVLYLPKDDVKENVRPSEPSNRDFLPWATSQMVRLIKGCEGRTLVLCTSIQNMSQYTQRVVPQVHYPCRMQGDMPRNKLVEWFKSTPHSVLFATATFWEGIDIPGDALGCVIIDKIPFAAPDDPIQQAMVNLLKLEGKSWFDGFVLPQAIIKLKQGFGRLIRTKSDYGIVTILDPRMVSKGYGKMIRRSLPTVPLHHRFEEIPPRLMVPLPGYGGTSSMVDMAVGT